MRGRLYEVDQYAGVRLDYRDAAPGPVADIVARVEEAEQNELQLGVGGGFDRANVQLRLRGRYKRRSFPFPLTNLELEATPEYSLLRADLTQGRFTPQARATWTWHDPHGPTAPAGEHGGHHLPAAGGLLVVRARRGPDLEPALLG
jgi:hypothetical protein